MSSQSDHIDLPRDQIFVRADSVWAKLPAIGGVMMLAGFAGAFALMGRDPHHFWGAYLTAFMFALALGLGGLFFVIVQHLTRAGWGIAVRRLAEHLAFSLPFVAIAGLVIVFGGVHSLYEWSHVDKVAGDPMLSAKSAYLNEGAFRVRYFVYLIVWSGLALFFWKNSTDQDNASDPAPYSHRMRTLSAPALLMFAVSLTLGAIDFLMSLDPHWFSTMFGVYYFVGTAVTVHAMLSLISFALLRSGYLRNIVTTEHFHDLGKFMFGFTTFWAYIAFGQYFLIWYADIPEETYWFSYRGHGEWLALSLLLVFGRFVIPWFSLLRRPIKRMPWLLCFAAAFIVFMEFVDVYWLVQPTHAHHAAATAEEAGLTAKAHWYAEVIPFNEVDLLALVGFIGLVVFAFGLSLKGRALVPVKDPRLPESVHFENF
ncbi:MAG: quinol:cytochrome C oxidoreductase [Myxococcales bacterium FL481]|nr:MAG: quinol:cytochrome C oxidoreductase [Myxococcales bacterium FL481]